MKLGLTHPGLLATTLGDLSLPLNCSRVGDRRALCRRRDGRADIGFAREFAQAVHAACPGKLLSYNCSPSFNWRKNLDDK